MIYSNNLIIRIFKTSIITAILFMIMSFLLTKRPIYSLIILIAAGIGISGFFISIKTLDRFLRNKKGRPLIFLVFFLKLIFITISFYIISKFSDKAALFYIAGISVIVISVISEGLLELFKHNKKKLNEG